MTTAEEYLGSYVARARRRAGIIANAARSWARGILFSLLRRVDRDASLIAVTSGPLASRETAAITPVLRPLAPPSVKSAIVINDDRAFISSEVLDFYLRGIFSTQSGRDWARSVLPQDIRGRTLEEVEKRLGQALAEYASKSNAEQAFAMCKEFFSHKDLTSRNRRAYSTNGRTNPNAVFWPDPTDPNNGRSLYMETPFARRIPLIDKSTRIVSAGSCFATELAHSLQENGYNYLVKESNKGKPGSYEFLGASGLPYSSAAWGVIFNTPSFRQLVEKAFEIRQLPRILWTQEIVGEVRYLDPFRENIGFASPEAYEENYDEHVRAAREALLEMDVFVITLGLNEVWYFKADNSVFSRSPWRTAPSLVGHRTLSAEENVADLVRMAEILRAHNPKVSIICTLSPISLHATFCADEEHIVTANAHSKAVLRVAAEEFARRCRDVYYFPSYEVVTTSTEHPWAADQRHVSQDAVKNVMALFHQMFGAYSKGEFSGAARRTGDAH